MQVQYTLDSYRITSSEKILDDLESKISVRYKRVGPHEILLFEYQPNLLKALDKAHQDRQRQLSWV